VTHLGLRRAERHQQLAHLAAAPPRWPGPSITVLLGDLNEWIGLRRLARRLPFGFAYGTARSFPAGRPLLRLDAIAVSPGDSLEALWAHSTPLARLASDHRPVCAAVRLPSIGA
jgi:endonuclease/exonuclease/phosphatase family metal-dependent hydrolase